MRLADYIPGHELVNKGLDDLADKRLTEEALLVLIGAPRLRRLLQEPLLAPVPLTEPPEHLLYTKLEDRLGRAAHSAYNALIGRLVSAENTLETLASRRDPLHTGLC
jgi:hypothetical protein